jgi:hypothetical protein
LRHIRARFYYGPSSFVALDLCDDSCTLYGARRSVIESLRTETALAMLQCFPANCLYGRQK